MPEGSRDTLCAGFGLLQTAALGPALAAAKGRPDERIACAGGSPLAGADALAAFAGAQRQEDLLRDAQRCGKTITKQTLRLVDLTMVFTEVPSKHLLFEETLVLLRERWQMELLYKL